MNLSTLEHRLASMTKDRQLNNYNQQHANSSSLETMIIQLVQESLLNSQWYTVHRLPIIITHDLRLSGLYSKLHVLNIMNFVMFHFFGLQ